MSQRCQLTGATPSFGKRVSHSHHRTSRRWNPNIQTRRYQFEGHTIRLRLSVRGIRTIDRIGMDAAVARMRANGEKI